MIPLAAEGGQGGGTAFILPPLYEIFWAAVVLLLILLVVGRFALPRLYAVLDERAPAHPGGPRPGRQGRAGTVRRREARRPARG